MQIVGIEKNLHINQRPNIAQIPIWLKKRLDNF